MESCSLEKWLPCEQSLLSLFSIDRGGEIENPKNPELEGRAVLAELSVGQRRRKRREKKQTTKKGGRRKFTFSDTSSLTHKIPKD